MCIYIPYVCMCVCVYVCMFVPLFFETCFGYLPFGSEKHHTCNSLYSCSQIVILALFLIFPFLFFALSW